eukprot:gene4217-3049_t
MDRLSQSYFSMTAGLGSQLSDPEAVTSLVQEMNEGVSRCAPLKNFLINPSTPRGDVTLTEFSARKSRLGWVTLPAMEGISRGIHEWCIKIEHQGDSTDASGLMVGIVPTTFTKFIDSYISQGGGWCLSRAGKFYGDWVPVDSRKNSSKISFGTGDSVILTLDYEAASMTIRVDKNVVVREINNLSPEVFPAISLHYAGQHVRFEYHIVHERHSGSSPWVEIPVLRPPTAFLPLSSRQLDALKLDTYVFSPLFTPKGNNRVGGKAEDSSAKATGPAGAAARSAEATAAAASSPVADAAGGLESGETKRDTYSVSVATSRLLVLCNAFFAVQRCADGSAQRPPYLSSSVTPEYLRKCMYESTHHSSRGPNGGGVNQTFNCGVVIMSHMFVKVASAQSTVALPLATSLLEYLQSLPLFSLAESQEQSPLLALETIQLATDNVVKLVDEVRDEEGGARKPSALTATLVELVVMLALQRGLVSETLRSCRLLLRAPEQQLSPSLMRWLQHHSYRVRPQGDLPNLHLALHCAAEQPEVLASTEISPSTTVLSTAYDHDTVYLHTPEGLSKWGKSGARYVELFKTREPCNACCNAAKSSVAVTATQALLVTDNMLRLGIAAIAYSITLNVQRVFHVNDIPLWPRNGLTTPLLASGPLGQVVMAYTSEPAGVGVGVGAGATVTAGAAAGGLRGGLDVERMAAAPAAAPTVSESERPSTVEVHGFNDSSFPSPSWSTTLKPHHPDQLVLSHCLALRKPSLVDLGSPEEALTVAGGHVTVELYVMLLDKEDSATIYQHGDVRSNGEVFIETVKLEGGCCIRGGFRHTVRGSCVVLAPIPPTAETRFMHIALVFDGAWTLFFDGVQVSGNSALQTSVAFPRQKWTIGSDCTCLIAGLRVWCVSRTSREVNRDYTRILGDREPGLVCNMFFNESSGNVVFNYVSRPHAQHGVCSGMFTHVRIASHPWKACISSDFVFPVHHSVHNWGDLSNASMFTTGGLIALVHPLSSDDSSPQPYATHSGRVVMFFDGRSGQAHMSMFVLPTASGAKGMIGCDQAGRILELLEVKMKPPGAEMGGNVPPETVVALANLTLEEDNPASLGNMPRYPVSLCAPEMEEEALGPRAGAGPHGMALPLPSGEKEKTYADLAAWLLQLLSSYAEGECSGNGELFSYMADDVSRRCVDEVKALLVQHFRVVKGSNARRAVSLKSPVSVMAIASALRVLLRLVRRARACSLHPSTLGLNVTDAEERPDDSRETSFWMRRLASSFSAASPVSSGGDGAAGIDSADALVALLCDMVNESSKTIPPYLGNLAKAVLFEGIELFFPDLHCRVNLLREMLSAQSSQSVPFAIPLSGASAAAPPASDKTPAVELLMDAMVSSLAKVPRILPLVSGSGADRGHDDTQRILVALVEESLGQLRKHSAGSRPPAGEGVGAKSGWGADLLALARDANVSVETAWVPRKYRLLASLTEAISALQLLLLSSSQQDRGREEAAIFAKVDGLFAFPVADRPHPGVRLYYEALFRAAQDGLRVTLRGVPEEESMRLPVLDASVLQSQLSLLRCSFLGIPLYTAVTAIPLVVTFDEAPWYLDQLEALLPLCAALKTETEQAKEKWIGAPRDASQAMSAALYKTVFFTSTWLATFMAQYALGSPPAAEPGSWGSSSAASPVGVSVAMASSGAADVADQREGLEAPAPAAGAVSPPPAAGEASLKPTSARRQFALELLKNKGRLLHLQGAADPLRGKVPAELEELVPWMAVAALYLCNIPHLHRLKPVALDDLLTHTMKRLFPVRATVMDRIASERNPKERRMAIAQEMVRRMETLLCFTSVHDINPVDEGCQATFEASGLLLDIDALLELKDIRHHPDFPTGAKARWGWALKRVKSRLLWQRADNVSNALLSIDEGVKLVSQMLATPPVGADDPLTAEAVWQECSRRNRLVLVRLRGFEYLLRLLCRHPGGTENVCFLLTCSEEQLRVHYLHGLNGAHSSLLLRVTAAVHRLTVALKQYQLTAKQPSTELTDTESSVSTCAPSFVPVLSKVANRQWKPRDFDFLCRLSVVDVIFEQSCSIFRGTADGKPRQSSRVYERIHRDAAMEYQKHVAQNWGKDKPGSGEEETSRTLTHTPEERSRQCGLLCLKQLAVQAAEALQPHLPIASATACATFLSQLLAAISKELRRCILSMGHPDAQAAPWGDLAGVVVAALPLNAQIVGPLHEAAAQVARLLCLFVKFDAFCGSVGANALRGAACMRVASKLLLHVNPRIANSFFEDAEVKSVSSVYFGIVTREHAAVTFLFSLIIRSLVSTGLSSVSQHAIIALRELLRSPRWARLLSSLRPAFKEDLAAFSTVNNSSESHAHVSAALKVYVWSTALGGCLLFLPGPGLPVRYTPDEHLHQEAYVLSSGKEMVTVVPTSRTTCGSDSRALPPQGVPDAETAVSDLGATLSEDNVFMPSFARQVQLPEYDGLLDDFVAPALERIAPMLEKPDRVPLDLVSIVGFLSIGVSMMQQPQFCEALVERGCVALINQLASRLAPRDAFPLLHLKEYAAYAISSMMKSLSSVGGTGVLALPESPKGELKLHPMPRSSTQGARTIMMAAPATLFSWSQARYTLLNLKDDQFSTSSPPGFPGAPPVRQPYPGPSPTLLCFPVGKSKVSAYVAVTCGAEPGEPGLLCWDDGLSVEIAVLMSDRMFPALGEDFTIPTKEQPREDVPLLRVSVRGNELVCTLMLPGESDVEVVLGLQWEDWDTFLYIGAFLDIESLTLCKGRDTVAKRLPAGVATVLNQRRSAPEQNCVTLLMLGTPPQPPATIDSPPSVSELVGSHHVLISGVRLCRSSKSKLSVNSQADEVTRDQALPYRDSDVDACYFGFTEGTGDTIRSSNGRCSGLLHGKVRWVAHSRKGTLPVPLECTEKLSMGTNSSLKLTMVPRKEVLALFSSLDALGLEYMTLSLLESLAAHLTRMMVVKALQQCLSPEFELHLAMRQRSSTFYPLQFLEPRGWAKQLANLLRFSDSGVLSADHVELITRFVQRAVEHLSSHDDGGMFSGFFEDTATAVKTVFHNSTELFPVDIPSQASQGSPLMPMSFLNGGCGVLSFDVKGRFVEHANIFKDRAKKTVLAKFPDNKGLCPDFSIPSNTQWLFVRSCAFSRHHDGSARLVTLNVMLRSMRPAVLSVFFTAVCSALKTKPAGYVVGLPFLLNSNLMTAMLPRDTLKETEHDSMHAATVLASILDLWYLFPDVQPFDRSPMHILLANINAALVSVLHRGGPGPDEPQTVCPALEAYNAYTRLLTGVLVAGVRVEAVWQGRSYRVGVWERWCRLLRLWEQSASQVTSARDAEGASRTPPGKVKSSKKRINVVERVSAQKRLIELEPVDAATAPPIVIHQRGSGEWFVRSERGVTTVRSSVGFTRGRIYFEVRMPDNNVNLSLAVGVVTEKWLKTCDSNSVIGQDAESWCFDVARLSAAYQGRRTDFSSRVKWKMGDVAGVLIDLESNRLLCFHNDRQVSTFERLKVIGSSGSALPTFFPVVYFGSSGCNINFGSAPFACRLPSGALPVDPSHFHTPEATRMWYMMSAMEWASVLPAPTVVPQAQGKLAATSLSVQHYMGLGGATGALSPRSTQPRRLQSPVLSILLRHASEYCEGRSGTLTVDLLCSSEKAKISGNEVRVEETPCLVRGSVVVYHGKWYYEVVTRDEVGLSIGWAVADRLSDWNRTRSLGDDEHSWALEGRRMIGKHNKQHITLSRHVWKSGNVVGCLLDCDAGTIAYTINGNVQREVHDSNPEGILFRNVNVTAAGVTPAVSMEAKSEAVFMWNHEDLLYLPPGYKPLGASCVITHGLTEHFLLTLPPLTHTPPPTYESIQRKEEEEMRKAAAFSIDTLEKMVRHVSRAVDLSPMNLPVYCLEKSLGIRGWAGKTKGRSGPDDNPQSHRALGSLGLTETELRQYLCVLHLLSTAVERIHPFCYEGSIPTDADGAGSYFSPLCAAFTALKRCCLSFVNLRVVRRLLLSSNGPGESLKLILNRRSALVLSRSGGSPASKLRDSLFGQVFHLLSGKPSSLFSTNKKLWSVVFFGEGAEDVGGPYRESLSQLCAELMSSTLPLFIPSPNQVNEMGDSRESYVPIPSISPPVELRMFQFIGRLMGGCLRSSEPLSLYLPSVVWRALVGEIPDVSDLERVDAATVQSLQYIASLVSASQRRGGVPPTREEKKKTDAELEEMIPDGFAVTDDNGTRHELISWGEGLRVNSTNAHLYIMLVIYFKLHVLGSEPLEALKDGFLQVVPLYHIAYLKWYELEELVCGQRDYSPDELLDHARYENIDPQDPRVQYLREVLKEFSRHQRASFMRFVTGRERLLPGMVIRIMPDGSPGAAEPSDTPTPPPPPWPNRPQGSSHIRGALQGVEDILEVKDFEPYDDERLPHASTCFYWLSLPKYSSKEVLKEKLLFAIEQCVDIDADFRIRDQDVPQVDAQPLLARVTVDDEEFEDYSHLMSL